MSNQHPVMIEDWILETPLPPLDKRVLLSYALGLTQVQTLTERQRILSEEELAKLRALAQRRIQGEPIAYITGVQEFFSREYIVNPSVLIPRPDTECLVEWLIEHTPKESCVLDLGTGSGCIAISLKLERPDLKVWACDNSSEALEIAKANATNLEAEVNFFESDWLKNLPEDLHPDVLVSNPPYINSSDEHLDALKYEPMYALTDFGDGLECIREILKQAQDLDPQPRTIVIEHGWDQGDVVQHLATECGFTGSEIRKDYGDNDRFLVWEAV